MDELTALLHSRDWVTRRVDRVEFLDLTTVRRTITLTVAPRALATAFPSAKDVVPLGWFAPWANAEASLLDANGWLLPYLTSVESDERVLKLLEARLDGLGLVRYAKELRHIPDHRSDPGLPGAACKRCKDTDAGCYRELMSDKWGCPRILKILNALCHKAEGENEQAARELAQILLAWQTNFVLFACVELPAERDGRTVLQLSYDEEVKPWERPWDRRRRVLGRTHLTFAQRRECRKRISRGGPFSRDLDALLPRHLRGWLAARKWPFLRKVGQRGLGFAWHVAWQHASGLAVARQQLEVILPSELIAVRMRMMRTSNGVRSATVADQVGARATIVAPVTSATATGWSSPTLFSLVITQRSPASWFSGFWIALLSALATVAGAVFWLGKIVHEASTAATVLVIAPALVAAVLSVRAGSEIAEQLTVTPRRLLGSLAALAALCAAALAVIEVPKSSASKIPGLSALEAVWCVSAGLEMAIAITLLLGAIRIRRLVKYSKRSAPRELQDLRFGKVLNPDRAPRIPPPDLWLQADEGDLVPWGWLSGAPGESNNSWQDRCFWKGFSRAALIEWVQEIFEYKDASNVPASCPGCRC
jgi:hypothetical protein